MNQREEAVNRIKDAIGFEYFKLPPTERFQFIEDLHQWTNTVALGRPLPDKKKVIQ